MIRNLQVLRAFAAISVMTFHFSLIGATGLPVHPGAFGVDLFFVLSGFIIAFSADKSARHFLAHRLIRVLPPYWIATFIGFVMVLWETPIGPSLGWFAQSALFLPGPHGRGAIIFVAWTLVYELTFYALYWIALRIHKNLAPVLCIVVLLFLAYGTKAVGLPFGPWPLLAEFAFGLMVFLLTKYVTTSSRWVSALAISVVALSVLALYALDTQVSANATTDPNAPRVLLWGVPAALIVLGLVFIERAGLSSGNRILLLLGDASYAMYLLHPLVLGLLLQILAKPLRVSIWWFGGATLSTVLLSMGYYLAIDAPTIRYLRKHLLGDHDAVTPQTQSSAG